MRLITGPAGSGKSTYVLERFLESLRAQKDSIRLLVPTATLAQHLQNRIAREGFIFRRNLIQTLSTFVEPWKGNRAEVSEPVLYLLVEQAVARIKRPEFQRVAQLPGFSAALARTIGEFSSAGCDSARLAAHLPEAPLGAAFVAVYREVDRVLEQRGLGLRGQTLQRAAAAIGRDGIAGIDTIWLDGFHVLPEPELAVIEALTQHAEVTLTLSDTDGGEGIRARLWSMGFEEERAPGMGSSPERRLVRAPNIEREADEIARRIVELAEAGRAFREIGIIVRAAETYVPILRSTLERYGIPARFYFNAELQQNAAARFLTAAVEAMLGRWDYGMTLAAVRLAPRFADSPALDRFDFEVREQMPESGLGGLKSLAGDLEGPLARLIDSLAGLEEWRMFEMPPADWAARFRTLRNLFRFARPAEGIDHESALLARQQAAALEAFDEAVDDAGQALDPERAVGIGEFWRAVKAAVRLKPLRLEDGRRNVVHVLSAPEARQWVLPVVFVCGMVEKHFPQFHPQDPFFPDTARVKLESAGIGVRTAAEFDREERALFESAITRATEEVTLSYPETDARGERNLPSLYLEDLGLPEETARASRPEPRNVVSHPAPAVIRSPALLTVLQEKTARLSPTGLESFLQCPFQYFGGRVLRLKPAPRRPEDRLSFLAQGNLVHAVLAEWYSTAQDVGLLFDRIFDEYREEYHIPNGYHTERLRQAMREDLERFAADERWPRGEFESSTEREFEFPLNETLRISGRIDRLDVGPDGRAYIIDYKYSGAQRMKKLVGGDRLQAPLYWMAAERVLGVKPTAMFYVRLKGDVEYAGWSEDGSRGGNPVPEGWAEDAAGRVLRMVEEMRQGRVAPDPASAEECRFCDTRDVCRIEVEVPAATVEAV
ncbi:MAG TPA: PD-(D/E)XK nuclease family protein [Bryobacteraceae bacterium]|nr:PD-(D/E)XK nuclease family protein [Bryobacteraceae bacterium]